MNKKLNKVAWWVLSISGIINAFLFFISLKVPQFYHLQVHHLTMLTICIIGLFLNYFANPYENRNNRP